MAPSLSHTPRRVVDNFYQNSFKQLSAVQQRQVGLLVGAAVADAAARPLDGYTREEVEAHVEGVQQSVAKPPAASSSAAPAWHPDDAVVFARVPPRGAPPTPLLPGSAPSSHSLQHHSFSYLFFFEMLRAMSRARGDFPVSYVQGQLVAAASAVDAQGVFEREHASLLHTLCCLLPTPAIYPYASDDALRQYVGPFVEFLTEAGVETAGDLPSIEPPPPVERDSSCALSFTPAEAAAAERAAVHDYTASALGVVLRNLQCNPDSTRNAAFMARPGTAAMFPTDVQAFVPTLDAADGAGSTGAQRRRWWSVQEQLAGGAAEPAAAGGPKWLPRRPTAVDAAVVRDGLAIARAPVSFGRGVAQAIHLGGPTCQRAMLVGALLGAKLGVRHIPVDWLSATPDHAPVATMALEVAQWSWNPPHH